MPIYEYRCEQGHTFEVMQRISDDPVATCQTCSAPVQRVFHPVAVHFKGSGFYSPDFGSRKRSRELTDAAEGTGKHAKEDGGSKSESGSGSSDGAGGSSASSDSGKGSQSDKGSQAGKAASSTASKSAS